MRTELQSKEAPVRDVHADFLGPGRGYVSEGGVPASSHAFTRGESGTQRVFAPSIISARRATNACIASRKRMQSARNSSETKSPGRLGVRAPGDVSGCPSGPGITPHLCVETVDNSELVEPQTPQRSGPSGGDGREL